MRTWMWVAFIALAFIAGMAVQYLSENDNPWRCLT